MSCKAVIKLGLFSSRIIEEISTHSQPLHRELHL